MRTNRLVGLFAAIAALAVSCETEKTKPAVLVVPETEISVPAVSGTGKILYSVENPVEGESVSATSEAEWLHGFSASDGVVTFTADRNFGDERSAEVTLTYAELVQAVSVRQMAADENIAAEPASVEFVAAGESVKVKVISSRNWTLTGGADWVTADVAEGAPDAEVTFTAEASHTMEARSAEFEFHLYNSQNTYKLTVSQVAAKAVDVLVDPNFRKYMLARFDKDGDGDFSAEELAAEGTVDYSEFGDSREGIEASGPVSSFAGLEMFTGITEFSFTSPVYQSEGKRTECTFDEIDFTGNKALVSIKVASPVLTGMNVDNLAHLEEIDVINDTAIHVLNTSKCPSLKKLIGFSSGLRDVDFSANPKLEQVTLYGSKVKEYDFTYNPELTSIFIGSDSLETVTFKNNVKLTSLRISSLKNAKTKPDFTNFPVLKTVTLDYYPWSEFSIPTSPLLRDLSFSYSDGLRTLDVHENVKLRTLNLFGCSAISEIIYYEGQSARANTTNCNSPIKETFIPRQAPSDIASDITDAALKSYLLGVADTDKDGKISLAEAKAVREIDFSGKGVKSVDGLEWFTGLTSVNASGNAIEEFPLDDLGSLASLDVTGNKLLSLDLSTTSVTVLKAAHNALVSVTGISGSATYVDVSYNKLQTLSCEYKQYLKYLDASNNELKNINVFYAMSLEELNISNNNIQDDGYTAAFRTWNLYSLKKFIANNYGSSMTINKEQELKGLTKLEQVELQGTDATYLNLTGSAKTLKYLDVTGAKSLDKVYVGEGAVIEDSGIKKESRTEIVRAAYK